MHLMILIYIKLAPLHRRTCLLVLVPGHVELNIMDLYTGQGNSPMYSKQLIDNNIL